MSLSIDRFDEFFAAVYNGRAPFPWQRRLAARVCAGSWPQAIALPTAAGKTGCIDVAVFALACRAPHAPRRILFVVDRRIVVDQAYRHAESLAKALREPKAGVLREVAENLCAIGKDESPLDVYQLRGGIFRENAWARSPIQPTIIASTVDQVGSRLLFRGYGVSDSMRPVHAGLVGNDALILLDEAHCANPFQQTATAVAEYRHWSEEGVYKPPFTFVSLTATPGNDIPESEIERDEEDDRKHPVLGKRIQASKPTQLVVAEKAKGKKGGSELAKELAGQARSLMGTSLGTDEAAAENQVRAVGIIVNRVATARELAKVLREPADKKTAVGSLPKVVLLTGRMRPLDREAVLKDLEPLLSGNSGLKEPVYVVATQCLEVGADLDFHALVTECASLDALRQRFGRLNRVAARPAAKAAIVVRGDQSEESEKDPVYGESLANTWNWLNKKSSKRIFDFGISAVRDAIHELDPQRLKELNAPAPDAPVMLPAHVDCWVQTHPRPIPDPDPAIFLHGPGTSIPDVQIVFRSDLGGEVELWKEIVALCPPSSSEALPVRMDVFLKWLRGELKTEAQLDISDVEGELAEESDDEQAPGQCDALRWRGENDRETGLVRNPQDVRPGDTFVVRCDAPDVELLGDFSEYGFLNGTIKDYAEEAFQRSRDKALLRLIESSLSQESPNFDDDLNSDIETKVASHFPTWGSRARKSLTTAKGRIVEPHPRGGWVVSSRKRLNLQSDPTYLDDSEAAESPKSGRPIALDAHCRGVASHAQKFASACNLEAPTFGSAGLLHDLGKLDPRFQAMLKGCSPRTARGIPLAKSGTFGSGNRLVHQYPAGARHELLSVAMAASQLDDDLLLHLLATHHGVARPFAPPVEENEAACSPFVASLLGMQFSLATSAQQIADWNSELGARFWRIVRRFGWWGSAYREAVFRLADHAQSRFEQEKGEDLQECGEVAVVSPIAMSPKQRVSLAKLGLPGLEGSNPLAFLAALGTLKTLAGFAESDAAPKWLHGEVRLSWGTNDNPGIAVLHLAGVPQENELTEFLASSLITDFKKHPASAALSLMKLEGVERRSALKRVARQSGLHGNGAAEWVTCLFDEPAPAAASQIQMVRRDYLEGNYESVLRLTTAEHLQRTLMQIWDYLDPLENQSLHWEPTEDRRHAYQWHQPSGDPTRKKRGGMLGANRLAMEAWPLFLSLADGERLKTRGFSGVRVGEVRWTWPLWSRPLDLASVTSLLGIPELQQSVPDADKLRSYGITQAMRSSRILVGKTPNLTQARAV